MVEVRRMVNENFRTLKLELEGNAMTVQVLSEHAEGEVAFAAFVRDFDFEDAFGCRAKDLGEHVARYLILTKFTATVDEQGRLVNETMFGNFVWVGGEWVDADSL